MNAAETPPFQLDDTGVHDDLRLQYRYIDLRRDEMQKRMRMRSQVTRYIRNHLEEDGYWDIETPMLTKATPEGARDYLVPSRTHQGKFFRLAAVATVVQTVADDVGHGPLLSDRALLP